jgi:hypothetical protein
MHPDHPTDTYRHLFGLHSAKVLVCSALEKYLVMISRSYDTASSMKRLEGIFVQVGVILSASDGFRSQLPPLRRYRTRLCHPRSRKSVKCVCCHEPSSKEFQSLPFFSLIDVRG